MADITKDETITQLLAHGAHFAHTKSRRHPSMRNFILGTKNKTDLLDIAQTKELLDTTVEALRRYGAEGKTLLFVSGKHEMARVLKKYAEELAMPYVAGRWLGGTLTNFPEIKKRIDRLQNLIAERESGELENKYTKLERLMLSREENRLHKRLGGLIGLEKLPDVLVVIDTRAEAIAVAEAKEKHIPIVAIQGSDCNVKDATYPIVANDASVGTVSFILGILTEAYKSGRDGVAKNNTASDKEE